MSRSAAMPGLGRCLHGPTWPGLPAGQGLNIALEDSAALAGHVAESGLSVATLRAFERERIPRVATMLRQEEVQTLLADAMTL